MFPPLPFTLDRPGYAITQLSQQDSALLQGLFERCTDFFLLTEGMAPAPTAAQEEFQDAPPGKMPEDLRFFGLWDAQGTLIGTIIAVQHYPDEETWWIGLMLLAPSHRGQGLGAAFYRAFERWLVAQGVSYVALTAIAANTPGRAFWQRMGFTLIRQTPPRTFGQKIHELYVYRKSCSTDH